MSNVKTSNSRTSNDKTLCTIKGIKLHGEILVAFWPKHDLKSNLKVRNFKNFPWGACPQTLKWTQWPYQSNIASSGPGLSCS